VAAEFAQDGADLGVRRAPAAELGRHPGGGEAVFAKEVEGGPGDLARAVAVGDLGAQGSPTVRARSIQVVVSVVGPDPSVEVRAVVWVAAVVVMFRR